ncbi:MULTISPECIES: DUF1990 family protein [Bacteria]|uniref:DUF1990 family protein n=1 Tax=Bacteria TaxID=2 RepID=UPI003C7D5BAA
MRLPAYGRGTTRMPILDPPTGMRTHEVSTPVPPHRRAAVAELVSSWELKRRVGFGAPAGQPTPDAEGMLSLRVLGILFREPVRVVWAGEAGFGYETRRGHPLYGEESFELTEDGLFTARSLSCPASPMWRLLGPLLRAMQRRTMAGYLREVTAVSEGSFAVSSRKGQ